MITNGPMWSEREAELLSLLRPCCDNVEIVEILQRLGYNRGLEAVSRKGRRLGMKFTGYGDPVGEFSLEETAAIDAVVAARGSAVAPLAVQGFEGTEDPFDFSIPTNPEPSPEYWIERTQQKQQELDPSVQWLTEPLPLRKDRLTKFVMLNDVHVPHNIPLDGIWEFCKDFKPDYMLLVGDIVNNDPFDHWAKEKPAKAKKMPQPKNYYKLCNEIFFRPMREAVGPDCTNVFALGNHEWWSNRATEYMPEGEGYWEVWNNVDPETVDLWVPWKSVFNLGLLHFTHGDIIRGGKYHPWQMLQYFHRNIRYGHYHDVGTASYVAPIDQKDRHIARCNGCLEAMNPHFMENRPHNWQHAFSYGYVRPDGTFNDYQVIIFDNKFIANGKAYESKGK